MHRKMIALAAATGQYPVAFFSDCAVYAADGPSPPDVLPYDSGGQTVPGPFRLGVSIAAVNGHVALPARSRPSVRPPRRRRGRQGPGTRSGRGVGRNARPGSVTTSAP